MSAIEINGLCKTFRGKKWIRVEALRTLDLIVEQGEVFGFLGPNGAGKSTTIKLLMGLISPSSGFAKIMGHDVSSPLARKQVGFLPENPVFYDYLNAEEHLAFVGKIFAMPSARIQTESRRVLQLLGLWDARKRPIRSYSKGMNQRLGLAQVLLSDPEVYILDEPMSGLDPLGRALVKNLILDLKRQGKSVFFSTHITSDVETVCDRVGIIHKGTLRRVDNVQSLLCVGITGYLVRTVEAGEVKEFGVAPADLTRILGEIHGRGAELSLVEPQRKHLEEVFLETVNPENI